MQTSQPLQVIDIHREFDRWYTVRFNKDVDYTNREVILLSEAFRAGHRAMPHTNTQYKVGDKVYYYCAEEYTRFKHYIRATVTEIDEANNGYRLRAFAQDLPGIYMFNVWDKDLIPRTDKSRKLLPVKVKNNPGLAAVKKVRRQYLRRVRALDRGTHGRSC